MPADVTKIATDLGVPEQEVVSMNRRMVMGGDTSLNAPAAGDEGAGQWQDWLTDDGPLQDERVADAEEARSPRDADRGDGKPQRARAAHPDRAPPDRRPETLEELSQVYDVSRERIRQIEVRAFEKLQ